MGLLSKKKFKSLDLVAGDMLVTDTSVGSSAH